MKILSLKKDFSAEPGKYYSVCLRRALRFITGNADDVDLYIYAPNSKENSHGEPLPFIATIVNQQHFRFCDLEQGDYCDNVDPAIKDGKDLLEAMRLNHFDFSEREIVTILRFEIL